MYSNLFYITIKPEFLEKKPYRKSGERYLVIGSDKSENQFEFINGNNEFDFIEKYHTQFAGLANDGASKNDVISTTLPEGEIKLSNGVKAEITKQVNKALHGKD